MNKRKIFVSRKISFLKCPVCRKIGTLHKSKTRNMKEYIARYLFFGYYRCWECNWRGIIFTKTLTKLSFKILLFYLILAICSSYIALMILKGMIG